ncbi:metal ABC transporter ATP-binding protein [Vibrio ishigakensis]|nr:ABC transporter ATP-binding protein [Vibrio ishigakensis]
MIFFNNLVIGYQNSPVTEAINGTITKASLTAIIGPNGAGKSTLLKSICGITEPISGNIEFSSGMHSGIAWLPQQSNLDRDFPIDVFEVVSMGCWPRKGILKRLTSGEIHKVNNALQQVGILDLKKTSIDQLSGGQFQRMLFARLLVQDTPIMLMDEPFAGIDEETQKLLLELIIDLHQQGKTIIAVLHDISLVERHFTDIIHIKQGCVSFNKGVASSHKVHC